MKKNIAASPIRLFSVCAVALAFASPNFAYAAPDNPIMGLVGASATYDDNIFRLAEGSPTPLAGKTSRSDMIYTLYAGLRVDKPVSLQRFQLDLTATQYSYRTYHFLNFTGLDYRAAWLWSLTPRLSGVLSADRTEAMTSYADYNSRTNRNVQVNESQRFSLDWWVDGAWHLTGGANRISSKNSADFPAVGNYVQDTIEGGVKYVSTAENSIAATQRESRGEYSGRTLGPGLFDTQYKQSETELRTLWRASAHSTLDAKLGYLSRTHEHYSQRNYSGPIGSLSYLWTPTDKLQLTFATGSDLTSYQETTGLYSTSYYISNYFSFTPKWLVSEKTALRLKFDIAKRDFRGAVVASPLTREDTVQSVLLGATWRPTRSIDVDAYLNREWRSSNAGFAYHGNIAGISAVMKF